MKKALVILLALFVCLSPALAQNKEEVKKALLDMNLDDWNQVQAATYRLMDESARATGYAKSVSWSMGGAGGFYYFLPNAAINDNKPVQCGSLSALYGGAGGFLFNLRPDLAVGGLFGGMGNGSSNKVAATYYSYSVGCAFELVHAQYKPIINDNIILGIDMGLGLSQASYTTYITDENLVNQDIVRSGSGFAYLLGVDVRKRITNTFFLSGKLGYFSASIDSLKRGDFTDPGKKLAINAPYLEIGLGGNF